MITIEKLYQATHDGLDIILEYYPQARPCVGKKGAKFKARPAEETASATLFETTNAKTGNKIWKVVDFGGDGSAKSPLDICMEMEGITRPYEAILKLAARYDVRGELNRSINKPDLETRPARDDEKEGTTVFELLPTIPENHLKILGPRVSASDAEALHWYEAAWVGHVRDRQVTMRKSNENFPIFMRECRIDDDAPEHGGESFFKIYEPLNPDKGFRFSYTPSGVKPRRYTNGLSELRKVYTTYNEQLRADFYSNPANEGKPFTERKIEEAFICSGERDALCCKSLGYSPLWFNSETYNLSGAEYREIMKYTERLYNIPDIDATGVARGTKLALEYIDIHTIWLPDWLKAYRDNRGKFRKDLRDWMELRDKPHDFRGLMELAMPAKFWTERTGKNGGKIYDIDSDCLHHFLRLNGFATLHDEKQEVIFVRITGNVVTRIWPKDIRNFLRQWATDQCLNREIRNLIINSARLGDSALENLPEVKPDFTSSTEKTQLFFFEKSIIEATPEGLTEHLNDGSLQNYVLRENLITHPFRRLPDFFTITRKEDDGHEQWDIELHDTSSPLMGYLVNTSRLYWRKEFEGYCEAIPEDEATEYRRTHKFCINGEGLTEKEIAEQKQNLVNKIFTIGYLMHRFKSPSRAWAPQAMDNKIGENGECNGRSGKSFLFIALSQFLKTVKLSGRNPRLMDNPHVFDQVTKLTDLIFVDDCAEYLSLDLFYDSITSDLTVNPKNYQSFTIPFKDSPKFAFTTNYVPRDFSSSSEARQLYMVFSDYYHQKAETNDYKETRSIRDDFGRDLFGSLYPEEDWNRDINFILQCTAFYLSVCNSGIKIQPPMGNIITRKYKADMGTQFEEWATYYFAEDSEHLDSYIIRREALEDYTNYSKLPRITMQKFTRMLKAFVQLTPYVAELNPEDLCDNRGRLVQKVNGKVEDMIYLRSQREAAERKRAAELSEESETDFIPDTVNIQEIQP